MEQSNLPTDAIMHVLLWSASVAGLVPLGHAVARSLPPPSLPARQGPLDRFRTTGSWLLAAAVCAFTYAFSDDPSDALPGVHKLASLRLWCGVNVAGLVAFGGLCLQEARQGVHESTALRLYWLLVVVSWGAAVVVRSDPLASDGLAQHPTDAASLCFYGLAAAALALGAAYGLFNEQVQQSKRPQERPQVVVCTARGAMLLLIIYLSFIMCITCCLPPLCVCFVSFVGCTRRTAFRRSAPSPRCACLPARPQVTAGQAAGRPLRRC
jgi:hypothetical protein